MSTETQIPQWLIDAAGGLMSGNAEAWIDMFTDDAVHEFPFAEPGAPARLEGKAAIREFMAGLGERTRFGTVSDVRVHGGDGDVVVVEAEGHHRDAASGDPFDLRYVWVFTLRDGRVASLRDYMGPKRPTGAQH